MGFNGDLYPSGGASVVMTTKGDLVRYDSERERYGIGSAGQVLQVASGLPAWTTINLADSVLTTQGDILYEGASALARLGQSTNHYTLATKGSGANPAWQASATSTLTTTGDVLYSSGANTLARLAIGSANDVLTVAGGVPTWSAPAGGGAVSLIGEENQSGSDASFNMTFTSVDLESYDVIGHVEVDSITSASPMLCKWNDDDDFNMISSWFVDANSDSTNGLYTSNPSGGAKISNDDDVPTGVHYQMNFLLTDAGATTRSPMYFQGWWGNYRNVWGVAWLDGTMDSVDEFTIFRTAGALENGAITLWKRDKT